MVRRSCSVVLALTGVLALAAPGMAAAKGNPMVLISTSLGDIKVELYPEKAPETVKNFLAYVDAGYYDGTIFHRVIPGFMIQGGGLTADMKDKTEGQRPPIKNESSNGLKNDAGTIAMARTSAPDSATSQFFINVTNNDFLNKDKAPGRRRLRGVRQGGRGHGRGEEDRAGRRPRPRACTRTCPPSPSRSSRRRS